MAAKLNSGKGTVMKKRIAAGLLSLVLILSSTLVVYANEAEKGFLYSGYTTEGVYYEVYETVTEYTIDELRTARASMYVERSVVYTGTDIVPPRTVDWEEVIGGVTYKGTLSLFSVKNDYVNNKTTCKYVGYLSN